MTYFAEILDHRSLNAEVFVLRLQVPEIASTAQPGQFVQLKTSQLLRRPLAVMEADPEAGWIEVGIQLVGKGTKELNALRQGDRISLMGPFGQGFRIAPERELILIGGGSGIFPLLLLAKQAVTQDQSVTVILGYQSKARAFLYEAFEAVAARVIVMTEMGDLGKPGLVTEGLRDYLDQRSKDTEAVIYACGPIPMLEAIVDQARARDIASQISLEVRMGCGYGVCRGCPVDLLQAGQLQRVRCCVEGPVFAGSEIVFESLRGEQIAGVQYD